MFGCILNGITTFILIKYYVYSVVITFILEDQTGNPVACYCGVFPLGVFPGGASVLQHRQESVRGSLHTGRLRAAS